MKKAIIFIAWVLVTTVCYILLTFTMGDYSLPFIFPYILLGFSQWMIISKRGRISAWFILVSSILWAVSHMMSIAPLLSLARKPAIWISRHNNWGDNRHCPGVAASAATGDGNPSANACCCRMNVFA
jgi:hypothetical protein